MGHAAWSMQHGASYRHKLESRMVLARENLKYPAATNLMVVDHQTIVDDMQTTIRMAADKGNVENTRLLQT